jgi:hypothetical protein
MDENQRILGIGEEGRCVSSLLQFQGETAQ